MFPEVRATCFGGPRKNCSILGSILSSPIPAMLENLWFRVLSCAWLPAVVKAFAEKGAESESIPLTFNIPQNFGPDML